MSDWNDAELERLETKGLDEVIEEVKLLCVEGLITDGGHHKQWYLERILEAIGFKAEAVKRRWIERGLREWEPGIAP